MNKLNNGWKPLFPDDKKAMTFGIYSDENMFFINNCTGLVVDEDFSITLFIEGEEPLNIVDYSDLTSESFKVLRMIINIGINTDVYYSINYDKLVEDPQGYFKKIYDELDKEEKEVVDKFVEGCKEFLVSCEDLGEED